MGYRNILIHIGSDERTRERLRVAATLAREFDARLSGIYVTPPLVLPAPYGDATALAGAEAIETQRRAAEAQTRAARAAFEAACAELGLSAEFLGAEGDPRQVVSLHARYFDLAVVGQSEAEGLGAMFEQLPERVVLSSGRPVLIVPYAGRFDSLTGHVVVAWNESREAARAVNDAMPLLERARKVTVFQVDPEDEHGGAAAELARRLAHHGVRAEAHHTVSGGLAAGEVLLSTIADLAAECLVMGAYGHSRVRELTLGGVTRTVLAHMTVPVIMSY